MNIKDAIRTLAEGNEEIYCKVCTVDAVDESTRTVDCTPLDESAPILAVNLQANQEGSTGIVIYPKVGSYIVVGFLNPGTAVVLLYDEVEKIDIKIESTTVQADKDGIVLNGGSLGGLVKVEALTSVFNNLIDAFNSHTHVIPSGGISTQGSPSAQATVAPVTVPAINSKYQKVKKSDYENEKVKQ